MILNILFPCVACRRIHRCHDHEMPRRRLKGIECEFFFRTVPDEFERNDCFICLMSDRSRHHRNLTIRVASMWAQLWQKIIEHKRHYRKIEVPQKVSYNSPVCVEVAGIDPADQARNQMSMESINGSELVSCTSHSIQEVYVRQPCSGTSFTEQLK